MSGVHRRVIAKRLVARLYEACDYVANVEGPRYATDARGQYIVPYVGGIGKRAREQHTDEYFPLFLTIAAQIFQHLVACDRAGSRVLAGSEFVQHDAYELACKLVKRWAEQWVLDAVVETNSGAWVEHLSEYLLKATPEDERGNFASSVFPYAKLPMDTPEEI